MAEGAVARGQEEVAGPTEVLVLKYTGEEGDSVVCCQNLSRGECSFRGANSQACLTHENCHINYGELLHECESTSPTLVAPLPNILHHLPSVLGRVHQASDEPHAHNAATEALEVAMEQK